ncbi:F-box only protein 6-like isoform X3 [Danio aesculapii]|uniref:F-box only protein 6-like isoform X3 n=1 Tax=Danio aesculapii TaxID=1142201 RepID=UPI0024C04DA3|nr:F-box only protein 6-like isoform X3 [Danio aesculapii]
MGQAESRNTDAPLTDLRSFESRSAAFSFVMTHVPLTVVEEILLNLPAHVVKECRLVCHEWKELVDSGPHWRERCRREGIQPCDASRPPDDWRQFYFMTKKRRNLIKNPKAEDSLTGWEFVDNGDDGIYLKRQLIDLQKEGYNAAFMDHLQPHIKISDWYGPYFNGGCEYQICVELLDQKKEPISTFQPEKVVIEQWNDEPWCKMTHVFKDYGPGVRLIRFTHGGKDTQFWAGHYGIRITNSSVEICPAAERE